MMRVTAGAARGHRLHVPQVPDLRPTKEIVRQAIFHILSDSIKNTRVLDLFAGSGSLGIEALSRGSKWCDFVDNNIDACNAIKQNIKHAQLLGKTAAHYSSAEKFIHSSPDNSYHLILADPPYELDVINTLSKAAAKLKKDGILIYLHAKDAYISDIEGLKLQETRNYGKTGVSFFTKA